MMTSIIKLLKMTENNDDDDDDDDYDDDDNDNREVLLTVGSVGGIPPLTKLGRVWGLRCK